MSASSVTPAGEPEKLWNKSFIMLLVMSTIINSASQMVTPLVSKFAISLGAPLTIATTIASMMSIAALLLRPFAGLFSDMYNRKKIIIISNGIIACCFFLMSRANTVPMLVGVRMLHGIAFSFNSVALMAFNTMFIPKSRLGEGMGWMALGTTVSQALGPNFGILLQEKGGYGLCFAVAAGICLVGIGVICIMPYEHFAKEGAKKKIGLNDMISFRILPYAIIMGLFSCGNGLVSSMLVLFGEDRGIENIGLFFTVYSLTMLAIRPFAGKLVDRKGLHAVLYPSIIVFGVAFVFLGNATALWMALLAAALKALGQGAGVPGIQSTCLRTLGREKAGVVSSTCYIGQDLGNAISPIVGGMIVSATSYRVLFNGYAVFFIIVASALYTIKYNYDMKKYGTD